MGPLWGLIGVAAGLWIGLSWNADDGDATITTLGPESQSAGFAEVVEGFPDVLLVVGTNGPRALDLATWPPAGRLELMPLPTAWTALTFTDGPFADFAAFDVSGRQLALASPVAREGTMTLLAGRPEAVVAVATGVTSYAWHLTRPRALAYVVGDGEPWIEVMSGAPRSVERVRPVPAGGDLVAWGDWGFLLEAADGLTRISSGETTSYAGRFLAAAGSLVAVEASDSVGLVDLATGRHIPLDLAGDVVAAAFDRSGTRLALARPDSLVITSTVGQVTYDSPWSNAEYLAWSTDGRFLVFADRRDVMILDVDSGAIVATNLGPAVAVATRPLGSSSR